MAGWLDAISIRHTMTYLGQECIGFYTVERETSAVTVSQCLSAWSEFLSTSLRNRQSDQVVYKQLDGMLLSDVSQIATLSLGDVTGTKIGDPMPVFVAATVQIIRTTGAIRHGWKRYPGVVEADVVAGVMTGAEVAAWNADPVPKLVAIWTEQGNPRCHLVVVKRIKYTPVGSTKPAYRLPQTAAEYLAFDPVSGNCVGLGSQNSRKR